MKSASVANFRSSGDRISPPCAGAQEMVGGTGWDQADLPRRARARTRMRFTPKPRYARDPKIGTSQINATHITAERESRLKRITYPDVTTETKSVRTTAICGQIS